VLSPERTSRARTTDTSPPTDATSGFGSRQRRFATTRAGPERVPFNPKEARIQRANEQLSTVLGHSIQIELDGALLPQTKEGAEDVIAGLVEDVVRDLAELAKHEKPTLAFAREHFEHLVVRYAPSEAAAREDRSGRLSSSPTTGAKFDVGSKTIDVARAEADMARARSR
jgi:hypothetical protein